MPRKLWIIEAPGKAKILNGILLNLGMTDFHVQATIGHIMGMPEKLTPVGIDRDLKEFMRRPLRDGVAMQIVAAAENSDEIIIATDADTEGDVIATDVADLVRHLNKKISRVRLKGMDDESVREAIVEAVDFRREDATPGRTRAILDRIIGATFSSNGIAVGRVGTALLGLVASGAVTTNRLLLVAPAKDGGRPWRAECDVLPPLTTEMAEKLSRTSLPMLSMKSTATETTAPRHTGDILVRASEMFDVEPAEVAKAMQASYESSRMSYPRSKSRGMSRSATRKMKRILEQAGARFNEDAVADKPDSSPHDAPHPLGPVTLAMDPLKLGLNEGVRQMVARDLVTSGRVATVHHAATSELQAFLLRTGFSEEVATYITGLDWRRDHGPTVSREAWGKSAIIRRRPDAAVLEAAIRHGLGTPSTWGDHIKRFINRGLVDDDLRLTQKGRDWLKASPPALLDVRIAAAIEKAIESPLPASVATQSGLEPWQTQARRILMALPEAIRLPILATVDVDAPAPGIDPDIAPVPDRSPVARDGVKGYGVATD